MKTTAPSSARLRLPSRCAWMYSVTRLSLDRGSAPIEARVSSGVFSPSAGDPGLVSGAVIVAIAFSSFGLAGQGPSHRTEQRVAVERLAEKFDCAGLRGAPAVLVVVVSGQDDHRNRGAGSGQAGQQVEAAHSGHAQIEDQAAGARALLRLQEGLRRVERLDAEAHRGQEVPDRSPQRLVVVHDGDHLPVVLAHSPSIQSKGYGRGWGPSTRPWSGWGST